MKPQKILFIHHAAGWGGAPLNMVNIIKNLDKKKYSPSVLLLKDSLVCEVLKENNIDYKIIQSVFYRKFYQYFIHSAANYTKWFQLYRLIKLTMSWVLSKYYFAGKELQNIDFDLAHLNSSALTDWLVPCKKKGKVVIHIQEPFTKGYFGIRYNFLRYQMRKHADHILAISFDNAKRVDLLYKTTIVYNFTKISKKAPKFDSYRSNKVLYVGGALKIKGFFVIIKALSYINSDVKVIFAGNYNQQIKKYSIKKLLPYKRRLLKAIQELRNNEKAIEVGMVTDITPYIDEVCCIISPFFIPHFSRPLIEAFANYKPVIASDVKGTDEVVHHNTNGIIVLKDDQKALAKAINYICSHPEEASEMGKTGYQEAVEKYSYKNINIIEDIYNNIFVNNREKI